MMSDKPRLTRRTFSEMKPRDWLVAAALLALLPPIFWVGYNIGKALA